MVHSGSSLVGTWPCGREAESRKHNVSRSGKNLGVALEDFLATTKLYNQGREKPAYSRLVAMSYRSVGFLRQSFKIGDANKSLIEKRMEGS